MKRSLAAKYSVALAWPYVCNGMHSNGIRLDGLTLTEGNFTLRIETYQVAELDILMQIHERPERPQKVRGHCEVQDFRFELIDVGC